MPFLYNRWYAAAWPNELGAKPFRRKILSEDITFYRKSDRAVAAVSSRCPHRFAPMYYGDVRGDNIVCRYHGLEFGADGACVLNPDGSNPPKQMRLKSYPVAEQDGMVWIWMGDREPGALPDYLKLDPSMGGLARGYVHAGAHYQMINDNLMDQSHVPHLHSMLRSEALVKHSKPEVRQEGDSIYNISFAPGELPNPFFLAMYGKNIPVDQRVEVRWDAPSTISIHAQIAPTGRPMGSEGVGNISVHLLTPETEDSTHYFWILGRNAKLEDHEFTEAARGMIQRIFTDEDKWILEGQVEQMAGEDFWALRPVLLPQDIATGMCRRHLDKLIAEQDRAHVIA
jgi:vanillate O-demethylase monooxygenase subunit